MTNVFNYINEQQHLSNNDRRFTLAYAEALLWSSVVLDGQPGLEDMHNGEEYADDCSQEFCKRVVSDCMAFLYDRKYVTNMAVIQTAIESYPGYTIDQAGFDFALTRNGHGAGYWDRGLGTTGELLTDEAEAMGSVDLFIGDDGLLYDM